MDTELKDQDTPEALLAGLHAYITHATELLEAKDTVELAELGQAVDVLCARIVALPAQESARYADELAALRDRIDVLGKQMETMRDAVASSIKSLGSTKKAAAAYQKNKPEA